MFILHDVSSPISFISLFIFKFAILPYYHLVLSTNGIVLNERVSPLEKILGTSKVQPNHRVTLIRKVRKKLKVNVGDIVVYVEDEKGNIVIKKGELKPL